MAFGWTRTDNVQLRVGDLENQRWHRRNRQLKSFPMLEAPHTRDAIRTRLARCGREGMELCFG